MVIYTYTGCIRRILAIRIIYNIQMISSIFKVNTKAIFGVLLITKTPRKRRKNAEKTPKINNIYAYKTIKIIIHIEIYTFNACRRRVLAGVFVKRNTTITFIGQGKPIGKIRRIIEHEYAGKRRKCAKFYLQLFVMQSVLNEKKRVCEHVSHK